MSENKEKEETLQLNVEDTSKVKFMAPSVDGGPDREVKIVYERKAVYGRPTYLHTILVSEK